MKVLLIEPPTGSSFVSSLGASAIPSTAYLAPPLEEEGHEVKIVDSPALGYDFEDVCEEMRDFDPDIVGVSAMTPSIPQAYRVVEAAKDMNPDCTTVLGGDHVTSLPRRTLEECPHLDIVVKGEGEMTMKEIASAENLDEVKGVAYRRGGEIGENKPRPPIQDLDSLPLPAYHLLPMEEHEYQGTKFATIMTSRGCPYKCTFCSKQEYRNVRREKSPERVLEQIKLLENRYGIEEIEIVDDAFTVNRDRAIKICDMIRERAPDLSWFCMSRVDGIDEKLAEKLKEAGCHTVYLGIESGVQEMLNRIKKGITLEQIKDSVRAVNNAGLNAVGSFILGIPGETREQMERTVEFAKDLGLTLAQFSLLTPYPGTEEFERAKEDGLLLTEDWSKYTGLEPVMKVPGMAKEELKDLMLKAYKDFYFRLSFLGKVVKEGELWSWLKTLLTSV